MTPAEQHARRLEGRILRARDRIERRRLDQTKPLRPLAEIELVLARCRTCPEKQFGHDRCWLWWPNRCHFVGALLNPGKRCKHWPVQSTEDVE